MNKIFYKFTKILSIVLIVFVLINILNSNIGVFAFDFPTGDFNPNESGGTPPSGIESLLKQALGVVQVAAGFVALISIIWLGVSLMKESPQGKAESKKKIYMILIGCLLVFGASEIVEMVATSAGSF